MSDPIASANELSTQVAGYLATLRQQQLELVGRVDDQLNLLVTAEQEASKKRLAAVQAEYQSLKDALTASTQAQSTVEDRVKAAEAAKDALVAKQ